MSLKFLSAWNISKAKVQDLTGNVRIRKEEYLYFSVPNLKETDALEFEWDVVRSCLEQFIWMYDQQSLAQIK